MNKRQGFVLILIALLFALSWMLVRPFLQYILMALLLAYVLQPLQVRLEPRLGRAVSAGLLVILGTLVILLPFLFLIGLIASDLREMASGLSTDDVPFSRVESELASLTGIEVDLSARASSAAERVAEILVGFAPDVVGALVHVMIGVGVTVFLLYYLLRDGDRLVAWIRNVSPLRGEIEDDLFDEIDRMVWAVLAGHVLVAIVQGVLAGIGLFVVAVPNAMFWTVVMVILGVIPLIGTFLVWAPAAGWLVLTGATLPGVALFVYGTVVVGISDDFLRPMIVGRATVGPSVIIVGVVGGMYVFGFMGLFVGPIIVGALKVVLELFAEHYDEL